MESELSILAIPGSLRPGSSSHKILDAMAAMMNGMKLTVWDNLAAIPPFDGAEPAPQPVQHFREAILAADAIVICTPEYAFGIPGALKNALDWTVSSGSLNEKPVALITAATNGIYAHDAMLLVLKALGAAVPHSGALLIRFINAAFGTDGTLKDETTRQALAAIPAVLAKAIRPAL